MTPRSFPRRRIVAFARRQAFAPWTLRILAKLGYEIYLADEIEDGREAGDPGDPDLWLADERRLAEVPDDTENGGVPIVVLSGSRGVAGADSRIAAAVRRPGGLHELYRIFQELLEDVPRSTPRVPTHIQARCRLDGRAWNGTILSLSENGCLLRSVEPPSLGSRFELEFALPGSGIVGTRVEAAYQVLPDTGLVFHGMTPAGRSAITSYVVEVLTSD